MSHVDDGALHAYLDGELPPAEAHAVEAHIAHCPDCRVRLEEERALIARADELLGLAAPPDRVVPPFRLGDREPTVRLWWRARVPLAWAASLVLAVSIGVYAGRRYVAGPTTFNAPTSREVARGPASAAPSPADARATAPTAQRPSAPRLRAVATPGAVATTGKLDKAADKVDKKEAPALSLDSARTLLGQDPVALPGVPIRAVRREPALGETIVVVAQALDSATVIEVRQYRPAALQLGEAAPAPRPSAALERARTDSVAPERRAQQRSERGTLGGVRVEVTGPLSPDSLHKLLQRLKPLKPTAP